MQSIFLSFLILVSVKMGFLRGYVTPFAIFFKKLERVFSSVEFHNDTALLLTLYFGILTDCFLPPVAADGKDTHRLKVIKQVGPAILRTFARKSSNIDFFLKLSPV